MFFDGLLAGLDLNARRWGWLDPKIDGLESKNAVSRRSQKQFLRSLNQRDLGIPLIYTLTAPLPFNRPFTTPDLGS